MRTSKRAPSDADGHPQQQHNHISSDNERQAVRQTSPALSSVACATAGVGFPRTALCTSARIPRLACAASFRKAGSSAQRRASRHRGAERQLSAPASGVRTCMPGSGRRARERASARCARPRGRSTVEEHGRRGRHSQPAGRADSIAWRGGRSPSKPLRGPE